MKSKDIFNVTLLTIITTIIWMLIGLYSAYFRTDEVIVEEIYKADINVNDFDEELLRNISNKSHYYDSDQSFR